jgi:NADH dehydrogenase (ubiquinone) Fe-S protein 6
MAAVRLALRSIRRVSTTPTVGRALFVRYLASVPEKVTHTGQAWSDDDYRQARFLDREKQVNEKFAIDLVAEEPVVVVDGRHVYCDGGHGALGHPKVYINLDQPSEQVCGYCGKQFIAKQFAK